MRGLRTAPRSTGRLMIGFALALLPLLTGAQPGDEIWRIGYLSTAAGLTEQTQIFLHRLRELGYVEGQNLVLNIGGPRERTSASRNLPQISCALMST
jgi:hypothetical protein